VTSPPHSHHNGHLSANIDELLSDVTDNHAVEATPPPTTNGVTPSAAEQNPVATQVARGDDAKPDTSCNGKISVTVLQMVKRVGGKGSLRRLSVKDLENAEGNHTGE
jgi:hypothetical protein